MADSELISIIVPVYNVSKYLDRCIESIVNQTYKNLEIILIDDGSTDDSLEKCLVWKNKDKRIIVLTKVNEGLGITRNVGVRLAKGDYIIFVDSDDYIDLHMAETLFSSICKNHADMVFCDRYHVISGNAVPMLSNLDINGSTNFYKDRILLTEMPPHLWGKIFKKSLFFKYNLWMTHHYVEDAELLPKLLSVCETIVQVKEPLYYYIIDRQDSIMMSKQKQIIEQTSDIFASIKNYLVCGGHFENMKEDIERYMCLQYFRWFYQNLQDWTLYDIDNKEMYQERLEKQLDDYFGVSWRRWKSKTRKRFFLWGGTSLKTQVIKYDIASYIISGQLISRYNFSSLISAMQKTNVIPQIEDNGYNNAYRKNMIVFDVEKKFLKKHEDCLKNQDIVIIDFLEERYDIVDCEGCYCTYSSDFEKLYPFKDKPYNIIRRNSDEADRLWKKACDKFVNILKQEFKPENVYLVRNYVHEGMRDYCCLCSAEEINKILDGYYDYFEMKFKS